jgi:hypothetical protein
MSGCLIFVEKSVQPTTSYQNVETIQHYDLYDPVPVNEGIYYLISFSRCVSVPLHLKVSM